MSNGRSPAEPSAPPVPETAPVPEPAAETGATCPHELPGYPFSYRGDRLADELAHYLDEEPVTRVRTLGGHPAWLVTSYPLARQALTDRRLSRGLTSDADVPQEDVGAPPPAVVATMAILRGAGLRDDAVKGLSPRQQDVPLTRVREIADGILARMKRDGAEGDLVADFALPWAAAVTCELLGLPDDAGDELRDWFDLFTIGPNVQDFQAERWPRTVDCFIDWFSRLKPTGLLPRLLELNGRSAHPLDHETMLQIGHMLAFSGLGNPAAFLATCALALARDPGLAVRLRHEPDRVPVFVEELYRWAPLLGDAISRIATEDVQLGDVRVRAGELVMVSTDAANRDPRVFPDPGRIDLDRQAPAAHLRFGQGRHYCPGAALNKLQTTEALHALLAAMPTLRLAVDPDDLAWRPEHAILMPVDLPVRWDEG